LIVRSLAVLACLCAWTAPTSADLALFEGREFETSVPEFRGVKANAPIPLSMHVMNEGGSNGAGLCVISSNVLDGVYQDVPELRDGKRSLMWRTAKQRPGGYDSRKFAGLVRDVDMRTPYFQVEDDVEAVAAVVRHYTEQGVPCATTYNTGRRYLWQWIAHMVTTIHLDDEWACVVDNNFPDAYFWMPASEWKSRVRYGGIGWAVVLLWNRAPAGAAGPPLAAGAALAACSILSAGTVLLLETSKAGRPA